MNKIRETAIILFYSIHLTHWFSPKPSRRVRLLMSLSHSANAKTYMSLRCHPAANGPR
jgi:hypothetical protein